MHQRLLFVLLLCVHKVRHPKSLGRRRQLVLRVGAMPRARIQAALDLAIGETGTDVFEPLCGMQMFAVHKVIIDINNFTLTGAQSGQSNPGWAAFSLFVRTATGCR